VDQPTNPSPPFHNTQRVGFLFKKYAFFQKQIDFWFQKSKLVSIYDCCSASFPGTKTNLRESQLLAGISMNLLVIPGNPSEMKILYQEKVFVAGRMSGNERLP